MALPEARHVRAQLLRAPLPPGPPQPGQAQGAARLPPNAPPEVRPVASLPARDTGPTAREAAEEGGPADGGADIRGAEAADGEEGGEGGDRGADGGDEGPPQWGDDHLPDFCQGFRQCRPAFCPKARV